jgi:4,5-dihydroxyphthalate decarboxylase
VREAITADDSSCAPPAAARTMARSLEALPMPNLSRRRFLAAAGAAGTALATSPATGAQAPPTGQAPAITLACSNYVRFLPIATGDVRPTAVSLTWVRGDRTEMLRRATDDPAIDGGETSMAQHVMRLDRGDRSLVAIPIFPLRNFTARDLYARAGGTVTPAALAGRTLGIYNWAASGAVWYRHLLRSWGHDPRRIHWVVGGPDGPATVRLPEPALPNVTAAPSGRSLSDLLLAGTLDGFFAPLPPQRFHPADGPIARVVADVRATEQRYFAATKCYPPQHVVVIRRAVWERNPAVGAPLVEAFNRSEAQFEALQRQFPYNSPWLIDEVEHAARTMGPDYHAHGLAANRHAVDVFCQAAFDDGLTRRRITVDEFFAEFLRT